MGEARGRSGNVYDAVAAKGAGGWKRRGGGYGSKEISGLHDVRRQGVCSYACLR